MWCKVRFVGQVDPGKVGQHIAGCRSVAAAAWARPEGPKWFGSVQVRCDLVQLSDSKWQIGAAGLRCCCQSYPSSADRKVVLRLTQSVRLSFDPDPDPNPEPEQRQRLNRTLKQDQNGLNIRYLILRPLELGVTSGPNEQLKASSLTLSLTQVRIWSGKRCQVGGCF